MLEISQRRPVRFFTADQSSFQIQRRRQDNRERKKCDLDQNNEMDHDRIHDELMAASDSRGCTLKGFSVFDDYTSSLDTFSTSFSVHCLLNPCNVVAQWSHHSLVQ